MPLLFKQFAGYQLDAFIEIAKIDYSL